MLQSLSASLPNAVSALLGRRINRALPGEAGLGLSPLVVTTLSMAAGAPLLLGAGLAIQGLPHLPPAQWAIVAWLAIVNTAFAFTLWNHTLRSLSAMESSIINSLLIVQIPVLAWVFLGEALTASHIAGLAVAGVGAVAVQLRQLPRRISAK
jgi:drug/metabolite transporter (DMT)-like permease